MCTFVCLDCLDDSDCATAASCNAGVCECNAGVPALIGSSASDTTSTCVECTSSDFGSCEPNDSCDTSTNLCVGKCCCCIAFVLFFYLFQCMKLSIE